MKNRFRKGFALSLVLALILCGCGAKEKEMDAALQQGLISDNYTSVLEGEIIQAIANIKTKEADYEKAIHVTLEGTKATITSVGSVQSNVELGETSTNGLSLAEGVLRIETAGDYVLQGQFSGQVQIDADKEDKVHLILNGVSISCDYSSAIYGVQSDRIYITLTEGTVNEVSDGAVYSYEEEGQDEPNAAIFSKDDLTFDGTGNLVVKGNYGDGIRSKDDLAIVDGTYEVESVKDALQGKDSVCITSGNFILKSGADAIKSSNDTEEEKGYVVIDGGTFSIQAGDDGVHGESGLLINGCKLDILSCYEGLEAKTIEINGGEISIISSDDGLNAAYSTTSETSENDEINTQVGGRGNNGNFGGFGGADGGKGSMIPNADCKVAINGGLLTIKAGGDGLDSNGSLYITGGEVYVNSSPKGADGALDCGIGAIVTGGTVMALGASGMATGFAQESTQCYILYNLNTQYASGERLTLKTKDGTVLLSFVPQDSYNSILISCPTMEKDGTYVICCGDNETEVTLSGNAYSEGGNGGFGGFGGFGGPRGDRNFGEYNKGERNPNMTPQEGTTPPEGMTPPEGAENGRWPEMPQMPPEEFEGGQIPGMPGEGSESSTGDIS